MSYLQGYLYAPVYLDQKVVFEVENSIFFIIFVQRGLRESVNGFLKENRDLVYFFLDFSKFYHAPSCQFLFDGHLELL